MTWDEEPEWRSVTDIVHDVIHPGEAVLRWANQQGLSGRSLERTEARTTGRKGGTEIHKCFEMLARGERPIPADFHPAYRGGVRAILAWVDRRGRQVLESEINLVSEWLHVKGRTDYLRRCQRIGCPICGGDGTDNQGGILGDGKYGRLGTYEQAHLQVSGYKLMWEEMKLKPVICGCEVLTFNSRGDARPFPVLATPMDFELAAMWHDRLRRLATAVRAQREAA